ncbi:hypothetical protein EMPS_03125 [Entomortierella parvispora]|uniref:Uncharacterized protein n=1 Tax=Entomortierella parvispora TaxID=205924 RepID=A0A9P3H677_9FUNG|nr:hypothetical protein EMPS_03125 [Entomortierella parvispora]
MDCPEPTGQSLSSSLSSLAISRTAVPSSPSAWSRLPTECLQIIITALTPDPGALAALLQVNRQLFFLVVPVLYYDPFKTLQDLIHSQNDSIRLCRENTPTEDEIKRSLNLDDYISYCNLKGEAKLAQRDVYGALAWSTLDWNRRNERMASLRQREVSLLATLLWTSIEEFCTRYPSIKSFYYPSSLKPPKLEKDMTRIDGTMFRRRRWPTVDFADYSNRGIVWTSQEYLRHVRVLDLARISTRQPLRNLHNKEFRRCEPSARPQENHVNSWEGKSGTFAKAFLPDRLNNGRFAVDGALDFLQRALLDKLSGGLVDVSGETTAAGGRASNQGTIWSLRIPAYRLRTYQLRQDRVPRLSRKKSGTQGILSSDQEPSMLPRSEGNLSRNGDGPNTPISPAWKPYGFTLERLTHLRRLEVCNLNDNLQNWKTLERVVAFLNRSREEVARDEDPQRQPRIQNTIREFTIQVQGDIRAEYQLHKILAHLSNLEVLGIYTSEANTICRKLWTPDLSWGQNLKSLKIGTQCTLSCSESFTFLGSFRNLVSLTIVVSQPHVFQWIVDKKASRRRRLNRQQSLMPMVPFDTIASAQPKGPHDHSNIEDCLPNLRQLSMKNCEGNIFLGPANSAAEAFGDQLEELVLQISYLDRFIPAVGFLYPFRNLVRLALRGSSLVRFFECKTSSSLAECCPSLEKLALQVDYYNRRVESVQLNTVTETLLLLTSLECLYLEQTWLFNDSQLLKIASECPRLRKIGCRLLPRMTLEGIGQANDILVAKRHGQVFPMKPAGLFRLTAWTHLYQEDHWAMSLFDPDRNE